MAANLSRLKNLGMGLAEEIEDQNKLIDRVAVKADKADIVIRDQDKQMKKIMGVKKPKAPEEEKAAVKKWVEHDSWIRCDSLIISAHGPIKC